MDTKITISITKSGTISVKNNKSEVSIGKFHGDWNLGPSTSSIMIFERGSKQKEISFGESSLIKRVLFSGIINEGSLLEFYNFIGENSKSGVLVIIDEPIKHSIFFKDGQIRFSSSNAKANRLGEILYRFGMIDKDTLLTALKDKSQRLGEKLIQMGALNIADLYKAIKLQIEEVCYSTFLMQTGFFYFYELVNEDLIPSNINIPTRHILFEGVRRMDEMTYFKKKLPSPDVILELNADSSVSGLTEIERITYKLINGRQSLRDISRKNRLGLFETTKIAFNFLQAGYVKIKSVTDYMKVVPNVDSSGKLIKAYNKVFEYIGKKSGVDTQKLANDVSTFVQKFEGDLKLLFENVIIGNNLVFDEKSILLNAAASFDKKKNIFSILYKAFDEIFYFLIFSSGIKLEPKVETELSKVIAKISSKG